LSSFSAPRITILIKRRKFQSCSHAGDTNVIESAFATVRHRTVRSKGCLSNKTALGMTFKLAEAVEVSFFSMRAAVGRWSRLAPGQ
jgi:hypothetical protein